MWNETLFLVSCAERIEERPTDHSIREIQRRILAEFVRISIDTVGKNMKFRLVFVHRDGPDISQEIVFLSEQFPITDGDLR